MKPYLPIALFLMATAVAGAQPFTPLKPEEGYGVGSIAWRFTSNLSKEATGTIEVCYAEAGSAERIVGTVEVRPFNSSEAKPSDLRILFTPAEVDGKRKIILQIGYGLFSGAFILDIPGLTTHSLAFSRMPQVSAVGEFSLVGFGDTGVKIARDGSMSGTRGRLFFRYVARG